MFRPMRDNEKMLKLVESSLNAGEVIQSHIWGSSPGFNRDVGNSMCYLALTNQGIILGWSQVGMLSNLKLFLDRFQPDDILEVSDGDGFRTGRIGQADLRRATGTLGRMKGASASVPVLQLTTRRGDISINFGPDGRGMCRETSLAIAEYCGLDF